jgi:TPR repeat protein
MEVTQKKPAAPVSKPEDPAEKKSDESTTEEATARAAQQADAKRKQQMAAAIDKDEQPTPEASSDAPKTVSAPGRSARASATAGDPRQNQLLQTGERFLYGRGGRRDCNQAVSYFREAAKQYNGPAMTHLGAMYASGNCVQKNRLEAYKWFSRAQEAQPSNQWLGRNMNMLWRQMTPEERASVSR